MSSIYGITAAKEEILPPPIFKEDLNTLLPYQVCHCSRSHLTLC